MTPQQIKDNAPDGSTHYLLVPNGRDKPHYLTFDGVNYYLCPSKYIYPLTFMFQHIKPI